MDYLKNKEDFNDPVPVLPKKKKNLYIYHLWKLEI